MKYSLPIFSFAIIVLGWIGLSQLFGKMEKIDFLRSHLCQEQLRLLAACNEILNSNNESQNERLIEYYDVLSLNHDILLAGGEFKYISIESFLPAEESPISLIELSNINQNLKKFKQLITQPLKGDMESVSVGKELIIKNLKQITRINELIELNSKKMLNWKTIWTIFWFLVTVCSLAVFLAIFKKNYIVQLEKLNEYSDGLIQGFYNSVQQSLPNKQFEKLYTNLDKIGKRFQRVNAFIEHIEKGNLDVEIDQDGDEGILGNSLIKLKEELKKINQEEQIRNWANEGLTKFNDIIYANNDDVDALAQVLISNLVRYVSANQGAIFRIVEHEGDQILEMISAYAWERRKYVEKRLDLKSNLIGQAVLEKEYLLINNVPDEFVNITSGLGEATPRSLIILPLIFNDVCCGAIELASFTEFDENKISFLNRLSENIASAILNITGNTETKKLLEESQSLTEQLKVQEEELRQNEEELQAAQENLSRKLDEVEAEKLKNIAILEGCEDGIIMFKGNGIVEFINSAASELFDVNEDHILGKRIENLIPIEIVEDNGQSKVYYTGGGQFLPITLRAEITLQDSNGNELSLLVTTSEGRIGNDVTFAFFIQKISVELF